MGESISSCVAGRRSHKHCNGIGRQAMVCNIYVAENESLGNHILAEVENWKNCKKKKKKF
jgi:hypothetical protein